MSQYNVPNILIVEDEIIVAMDIQDCLSKIGHSTCGIAFTGEEAIAKVSTMQPNLVLMDIKLGGDMDGVAAARIIYEQFNIPVIYLTAYSDKQTLDRAKKTGPFGYILKPMEENELRSAIDVALFKHKMESELKENKRWLKTILNTINDGIISTDNEGFITFMNPVAESITGIVYEDGTGLHLDDVFTVVDEAKNLHVKDVIHYKKQSRSGEDYFHMVIRDEKIIPIDWSVAPIVDSGNYTFGFIIVFRDITKFRRTEAFLEHSRNELKKLVKEQTMELQITNSELQAKSKNLEEMNTALKIIIKSREEDKRELEENIVANVKSLMLPYVDKLKKGRLDPINASCLDILEKHLKNIISSFLRKMASFSMTPKEIQIASLIREGKTTKEIADLLNIAQSSVDFHRHNIRAKLGITNERANLQTYLMSLE